jgi:hypothetical protein
MKRRPLLAASLMLAGTATMMCASAAGAPITAQSVQSVANAIETANRANDTDKANAYLADDCVFHATVPSPEGGTQLQTMTRQQYLDDQTKTKSEGSNEVYKSTTPVVTIKEGKASAQLRVTDSQIDNGKSVTTVSDQTETFGDRNGHLMVTAVDVTVVSVTVDGNRLF